MNTMIFNLIASLVNSDRIGSWCRALVAAAAPWVLLRLPFAQDWFTPEVQGTIATFLSVIAVGIWADFSKKLSAPTVNETAKVVGVAVDKGALTPAKAAEVKAAVVDDSIK